MESTTTTDVLIVGAGAAGLTLACSLAQWGVSFRIIDSKPAVFEGSRAKGIQPRTLEVLEDLGVIDRFLANGTTCPPFRMHFGRNCCRLSMHMGTLSKVVEPTPDVPYPNAWLVPQFRTEEILREKLSQFGYHVEQSMELVGLTQNGEGVEAALTSNGVEKRIQVKYLVGCDGGHSIVRKLLDVKFDGESVGKEEKLLVGDVRLTGSISREDWHVWPFARGCRLALCPLPSTDLFQLQAFLHRNTAPPELNLDAAREFLEKAIGPQEFTIADATWLSIYRPQVRLVDRYRVGRVFLAGDAAHVHPPTGGQGLNTSTQDSYNLGWKLAVVLKGGHVSLLDTYEHERLPIAASVLGMSKKLLESKSMTRGKEQQQLHLHYHDSPISINEIPISPKSLQAGDRAPDAICMDHKGQRRRLFEVFSGPHATVLVFGEPIAVGTVKDMEERWASIGLRIIVLVNGPAVAASEHELVDPLRQAASFYGAASGTVVLIRPDGYIGLVASQFSSVDRYLTMMIAPK